VIAGYKAVIEEVFTASQRDIGGGGGDSGF